MNSSYTFCIEIRLGLQIKFASISLFIHFVKDIISDQRMGMGVQHSLDLLSKDLIV